MSKAKAMSEAGSALKVIRLLSFIYFGGEKNVEKKIARDFWVDVRDATLSLNSTRS